MFEELLPSRFCWFFAEGKVLRFYSFGNYEHLMALLPIIFSYFFVLLVLFSFWFPLSNQADLYLVPNFILMSLFFLVVVDLICGQNIETSLSFGSLHLRGLKKLPGLIQDERLLRDQEVNGHHQYLTVEIS